MRKILIVLFIGFLLSIISCSKHPAIIDVSYEQLRLIKIALGDGIQIKEYSAVKSLNHQNAYYIGVSFNAEGVKDKMTGIWLISGTKSKPGLVYSVNGFAHQFSGMRKASETKAAVYLYDQESQLLLKYLK